MKTLILAAIVLVVMIALLQLGLLALAQTIFTWACAAAALACAVIWGRIILTDTQRGKTNYRRMTWQASPDIFVQRRQTPAKFWRLIGYKVLSLLFIVGLCVVLVLHALTMFLVD